MNVQRTNITLPIKVLKQLQTRVPAGKRSTFIAEAITEKLSKQKPQKVSLEESLKVNAAFYKKEAEIWKVTETENWPE